MSGDVVQVTIAGALEVLNLAINASAAVEKYRQIVAAAVAEGRDISDAELEKAAQDLDAAIANATPSGGAAPGTVVAADGA